MITQHLITKTKQIW